MNQLRGIILGLVLISGTVFMPAESFAQVANYDGPYSSFFELLKYLFSSGNVTIITNSDSISDFNQATIILTSSTTTTNSGGDSIISINNVSLTEGNSGTKTFVFTITRSGNIAGESSVNFATSDGIATLSNSDYLSNSGTLNFASTETTKTITVLVIGDTTVEPNETFNVNLSTCVSCVIIDNQGLGTITDDDSTLPNVTINDVTLTEGNSGTSNFVFTVTRSNNTGTISVNYSTANNTATESSDYIPLSTTTLNFPDGGPLSKTLSVSVNGDVTIESNETFFVNLTSCVGCNIADNQGLGTITNDDSAADNSGNDNSGDDDSEDDDAEDDNSGDHGSKDKETICHTPPGNPDKSHTITVGKSAVSDHLAHGDYLGKCDKQDSHKDQKESKKHKEKHKEKHNDQTNNDTNDQTNNDTNDQTNNDTNDQNNDENNDQNNNQTNHENKDHTNNQTNHENNDQNNRENKDKNDD